MENFKRVIIILCFAILFSRTKKSTKPWGSKLLMKKYFPDYDSIWEKEDVTEKEKVKENGRR